MYKILQLFDRRMIKLTYYKHKHLPSECSPQNLSFRWTFGNSHLQDETDSCGNHGDHNGGAY